MSGMSTSDSINQSEARNIQEGIDWLHRNTLTPEQEAAQAAETERVKNEVFGWMKNIGMGAARIKQLPYKGPLRR